LTLDSYDSGVNIVRVNFDKADPPQQVIDAFRDVQAAAQERDRLQKQADAYANRVLAEARGEAAQLLEEAEGYRARVVNEAEGEASRFTAVLTNTKAPEVTRKRLYLETMEQVLGDRSTRSSSTIRLAGGAGSGVVPYLPLNELRRGSRPKGATDDATFHLSIPRDLSPFWSGAVVDLHRRRTRKGPGAAIRPGRQRVKEEPGLAFKIP
jgi:membrane protease subunit HflK